MHVFVAVLKAVLVLLGIGIVGYWITRRDVIPEKFLGFLIGLALNIALPCMVFASLLVNFSPEKFPGWWQLPLWWFLFAGLSLILTLITMFVSDKETRGEFAINLFYQNGLFFPLIIISGIFGPNTSYLPQLYVFVILHPVMLFSTYSFFFNKKSESLKWNRIINPILAATVAAVGVQLLGVRQYLPDVLYQILQILGGMALPLVMIILGGALYLDLQQGGKFYYGEIAKFLVMKNIIFPLVFLAILIFWRPSYSIALLFFLQSAIPPVTATPILTERAGGNKSISNQFVFASFVFSVFSVPAVFYLFNRFFPAP
jgi:predicted permease